MSREAQEGIAERLQALKRSRPPDPAAPLPKRARVQDQQLGAFNRRVEPHPQRQAAALQRRPEANVSRCSEIDSRSDLQFTLLPSFSQEQEPPPKRVPPMRHTKKSIAAALKAQGRYEGPPTAFGQRVPPPRQPPAKAPAPPANAPAPAPAPAPVPAPAPLPSLDMPSFGGGQVQTWMIESESESLLQGPLPEPNLFNDSGSFEGVYGLPGSHSGHQQSLEDSIRERRRQQNREVQQRKRMELQSPAFQGPNRSAARIADGSPAAGDVEEVNIRHHLMGVLLESPAPRIDWQADRQQQAS